MIINHLLKPPIGRNVVSICLKKLFTIYTGLKPVSKQHVLCALYVLNELNKYMYYDCVYEMYHWYMCVYMYMCMHAHIRF